MRKRLYVAYHTAFEENTEIFKKIILLRHSNANMLGYDNHAAFKLKHTMAKSPEWVVAFLQSLEEELVPQGEKEMELLLYSKTQHLQASLYQDEHPTIMTPWDFPYHSRLAQNALDIDYEQISEYFPLKSVISGLLTTLSTCLGLRFDGLTAEQMIASSWHKDVVGWAVWEEKSEINESKEFVGYLFMDLIAREHKYRGSQNVNLQSVSNIHPFIALRPCVLATLRP